jgi:hypothetical protein
MLDGDMYIDAVEWRKKTTCGQKREMVCKLLALVSHFYFIVKPRDSDSDAKFIAMGLKKQLILVFPKGQILFISWALFKFHVQI